LAEQLERRRWVGQPCQRLARRADPRGREPARHAGLGRLAVLLEPAGPALVALPVPTANGSTWGVRPGPPAARPGAGAPAGRASRRRTDGRLGPKCPGPLPGRTGMLARDAGRAERTRRAVMDQIMIARFRST